MGCSSSKRVEAKVAADVYRQPPASIALFDISKIDEPWLLAAPAAAVAADEKPKPAAVPFSLLEKLESLDLAPKSWSEVSKALEDLKPALLQNPSPAPPPPPPPYQLPAQTHTPAGKAPPPPSSPPLPPPPELAGFRAVKENSFVIRDRQEREQSKKNEGRRWKRPDPFEGYPERRPPGNSCGVVLYTTTLRGVRRTFEDCERLRQVVEAAAEEAGVLVDERDVSLHGEYLKEMREMAGEGSTPPRLFVAGRYLGGAEEVAGLAETGKLGEMMRSVARRVGGDRGKGGRRECEGCGGMRFVPCLECGGSCKVLVVEEEEEEEEGRVERCGACNENGLVLCPMCH
ncbi:Uncharacterized protein AXF42_Ash017209 [Apostasia shenzhenica]|uniref:Glutaredoxin domain-containing protein n=1 Tax=Apostasia shenzhenica TaxID=1088818 RepID=A0A2H9ZVF0_9ASPA|nr:Uncharacterized protein AXF42_Ash017209 [Apostasia shenzhenica]